MAENLNNVNGLKYALHIYFRQMSVETF